MPKLGPRSSAVRGRVRYELARQGLRGTDVAKGLGMTKQAVSRRKRGVTPWSVDELEALADLLGVPFARLLCVEDAPEVGPSADLLDTRREGGVPCP